MTEKISIIIPVYNVEHYIYKTLSSVVNQTYKNLEIIVVNDGSTDNSMQIVEKFAKEDDRFVIINQENGGVSKARNTGLKTATGEFIGWVDPDDWIAPQMFEKLLKALLKNEAQMSICEFYHVYPTGYKKKGDVTKSISSKSYYNSKKILEAVYIPPFANVPWNKLFRKELYDDITYPEGIIFEGSATNYKLISKISKAAVVKEPLYYYRRAREGSYLSSKNTKKTDDSFIVYPTAYKDLKHVNKGVSSFLFKKILKSYLLLKKRERKKYPDVKNMLLTDMKHQQKGLRRLYLTLLIKFNFSYNSRLAKLSKWTGKFVCGGFLKFSTYKPILKFIRKVILKIVASKAGLFLWMFIPKSKKRMIFFSGANAWDNSWSVYNELVKHNQSKKYKITWLVTPGSYPNEKQIKHGKTVRLYTLLSYWHFHRAKYIFTTHSLRGYYLSRGHYRVELWHGGVPIKSRHVRIQVGTTTNKPCGFLKSCRTNLTISSSEWFKPNVAKTFIVPENKVAVTGIPKTDDMFTKIDLKEKLGYSGVNKIFLWMPTWRDSVAYQSTVGTPSLFGLPLIDYKNVLVLNDFLKEHNCIMLFKTHPGDNRDKYTYSWSNIINVYNLLDDDLSLYTLVGNVDVFITDYSNIGNDYLALNKPIAYVWDDFDSYLESRGFHFENPKEYLPGPHIDTFEGLINFIGQSIENVDDYELERIRVNKLFNDFSDGKSSYRVLKALKIIKK